MAKLSAARVGVLRAIAAGTVWGSCSVYDLRFPKWEQETPGSHSSVNVTAQYHALVSLGLVAEAKPDIGQMVLATLTDAGQEELGKLDVEPSARPQYAKCWNCGKNVQLKTDGTMRFHLRKKDSWYRPPECIGSGQVPASIDGASREAQP